MNPLHWKREYQLAWVLVSLIGGISGTFVTWLTGPFYNGYYGNPVDFSMLLMNASFHWPWPVFGALVAALAFYTVRLLQIAGQDTAGTATAVEQPPGGRTEKSPGHVVRVMWHLVTTLFGYALWGTIIVIFAVGLLQRFLGH